MHRLWRFSSCPCCICACANPSACGIACVVDLLRRVESCVETYYPAYVFACDLVECRTSYKRAVSRPACCLIASLGLHSPGGPGNPGIDFPLLACRTASSPRYARRSLLSCMRKMSVMVSHASHIMRLLLISAVSEYVQDACRDSSTLVFPVNLCRHPAFAPFNFRRVFSLRFHTSLPCEINN